MRSLARFAGNLLLAASLAAIVAAALSRPDGPRSAPQQPAAISATETPEAALVREPSPTPELRRTPAPTAAAETTATPNPKPLPTATAAPTPTPLPFLAITHLELSRTGLEADVVPAPLTEQHGVTNWEVPAFYAGHAEGTAGAGQEGTAVLFGHVTSVHSGNVFEHLDRAMVGDLLVISSDDREFAYRVDDVRAVARDDLSVLDPAPVPTVELITCTGVWDPKIWDYTERLVVTAVLDPRTPFQDVRSWDRRDPPLPP